MSVCATRERNYRRYPEGPYLPSIALRAWRTSRWWPSHRILVGLGGQDPTAEVLCVLCLLCACCVCCVYVVFVVFCFVLLERKIAHSVLQPKAGAAANAVLARTASFVSLEIMTASRVINYRSQMLARLSIRSIDKRDSK